MEISYLGHSSFKIIGKDISVVCDPFDMKMVGVEMPKVSADVVTISHNHLDHNNKAAVKGDFVCFDTPGEYEIKGAEIIGIESDHDASGGAERGKNTIFTYQIDGIHVCHLGDLGCALSSEQLEKMNRVDVLMIPVGGKYTIDAKEAAKVISDIDPKIVTPMHFRIGKMTDLDPLDKFLDAIGKTPKKVDTLKIQKKDLPEEMEVIVLKS